MSQRLVDAEKIVYIRCTVPKNVDALDEFLAASRSTKFKL